MRAALAVPCMLALFAACRSSSTTPVAAQAVQPVVTFLTGSDPIAVTVEIARDPAARARGLMHRDALGAFAGMVFIFPAAAEHPFWMKNTLIPLDIMFVNEQLEIVGIIDNAEPLTEQMRSVEAPSRYVVEVNGGFAAKHGIVVGTRVAFEDVL